MHCAFSRHASIIGPWLCHRVCNGNAKYSIMLLKREREGLIMSFFFSFFSFHLGGDDKGIGVVASGPRLHPCHF